MIATGAVEVEQHGTQSYGRAAGVYRERSPVRVDGYQGRAAEDGGSGAGRDDGAQLRFRSGDDDVEVLSGDGQERVHSKMKIKQKEQQ